MTPPGKKAEQRRAAAPAAGPTAPAPSAGSLAGLVALGAAASLLALFLWTELLASRTGGGAAFCGLGDAADCTALWDAPFAAAVHRYSGLPLAAWGLVWGLAAFVLPLLALWHAAEGRPQPALVSATRVVAAAGVLAVLGLFGVSAVARTLCAGCFGVYVIVAGYAGIALYGWKGLARERAWRGAALAAGASLGAALLLLYAGLHTPKNAAVEGRQSVASAPAVELGTGDAERDRYLAEFIESLAPPLRQSLADSLGILAASPAVPLARPRQLLGAAQAAVRITEWSDVLCDHCANLHETLSDLLKRMPPGSFGVDSRQFPLDGACNPLMAPREGASVRCLAARARICVQGPRAWDFAGELFAQRKDLTPAKVFALAAPYMPREQLEACVASEPTRHALAEDIRLASAYDPEGTPIVAVDGRRGTSFGPFLYAMILTGGEARHPAFRALPPPNPEAHIH